MPQRSQLHPIERLYGRTILNPLTGCRLWVGPSTNGYGKIWVNGRAWWAHRLAYSTAIGPIPEGKEIDHLCRVRACVNPAHLEAVTRSTNCRRGMSPVAVAIRSGLCKRDHPLVAGNLYFNRRDNKRQCARCVRDAVRKRKANGR